MNYKVFLCVGLFTAHVVCAVENDSILFDLRKEYDKSCYVQCYDMSRELSAISAALNRNEYPWLPLSHRWTMTENAGLSLWKHQNAPIYTQIYTFGSAERHKLAYLVQEGESGGIWRTMHSYAPTRSPVFEGARSQKAFEAERSLSYTAGHCVDHADTPHETLNFYGRLSTDCEANLIPEPFGGWGIRIRSPLVKSMRGIHGNAGYSQFVYYGNPAEIAYTIKPWKAAIPKGVLFLEHNHEISDILTAWKIDWNDATIHSTVQETPSKKERGGVRYYHLRNHLVTNKKNEQIFSGNKKPNGLAYIYESLDPNFDHLLEFDDNILDPLARYRLQILADKEIIPFYISKLIQYNFNEGLFEQGFYWTKRLMNQAQLLIDNERGNILNSTSISSIVSRNLAIFNTQTIDHLNSILKDAGFDAVPVFYQKIKEIENTPTSKSTFKNISPDTSPRTICFSQGSKKKGEVKTKEAMVKEEFTPGTPLVLDFKRSGTEMNKSHKGAITTCFETFRSLNQEYIDSPDSNIPYVQLTGAKELVSSVLRGKIEDAFKGIKVYDFNEQPSIAKRIDFSQEAKGINAKEEITDTLDFFEAPSEQNLITHRHDNPKSQHEYDKRFGLILFKK